MLHELAKPVSLLDRRLAAVTSLFLKYGDTSRGVDQTQFIIPDSSGSAIEQIKLSRWRHPNGSHDYELQITPAYGEAYGIGFADGSIEAFYIYGTPPAGVPENYDGEQAFYQGVVDARLNTEHISKTNI